MSYNPPAYQVWVKLVGLPLQAWTQPEITTILQNLGHPIDILPYREEVGHYTDITALVNTRHPTHIPLALTYRECLLPQNKKHCSYAATNQAPAGPDPLLFQTLFDPLLLQTRRGSGPPMIQISSYSEPLWLGILPCSDPVLLQNRGFPRSVSKGTTTFPPPPLPSSCLHLETLPPHRAFSARDSRLLLFGHRKSDPSTQSPIRLSTISDLPYNPLQSHRNKLSPLSATGSDHL